jgi:hypothetical protein
MTSPTTSKAQRRAEAQRRAAEKRAAELRKKRVRRGLWLGGVVVAIAAIVLIVTLATSGSGGNNNASTTSFSHPNVPLQPVPASMSSTWKQPPASTPGPETVGIPSGPKLATLDTVATGQTVDGIQCQTNEQTIVHVHTHLTIFVNGQARVIPYGIGIPGAQPVSTAQGPFVESGSCFYWLHAHANDGIIHIESPSTTMQFTLGQFFQIWGIPLNSNQVGPVTGKVTAFLTYRGHHNLVTGIYNGDPANLPLGNHYQIQLDVGTPIVAPYKVSNWGGL